MEAIMAHTTTAAGCKRPRRRALGGFEHFMWRAHKMGCGLIYAIADLAPSGSSAVGPHPLAGDDAPDLVRQAALLCARRHPNLRARLGVDHASGEPYLEELAYDDFIARYPIEVPLVTDQPALQFTEALLLSTPIPHAAAPLWQLALVRHAAGSAGPQLVVLAHHSVLDGDSVVLFLRELVANVNLIRARAPQSPGNIEALLAAAPAPLPFLPAQDELYASLLAGEGGDSWWSRMQFALKRLSWLVHRPTVPPPERITTDSRQRRNRIYSTQVQGGAFERLLQRCKGEGTTLTAAIAAAVMLEIKALIPGPSAALKIETMVNLRGQLAQKDPRLAESLHLFAAPIDMVIPVDDNTEEGTGQGKGGQQQGGGLWARARSFKADLNDAMADGQWRHQVAAFHSFQRGGGFIYRVLERLAVGPMQGRVKAAAVSNLGSLDAKLGAGGGDGEQHQQPQQRWGISRLQWGITEHGIGQEFFVAVSSQRGALNLTLTCVDPIVSPARADALLAGIVRRLLEDSPAGPGPDPVGRVKGEAGVVAIREL